MSAQETLTPTDAVLEVGSRTVRLGSLAGAWKELEATRKPISIKNFRGCSTSSRVCQVTLPFEVRSLEQPAAACLYTPYHGKPREGCSSLGREHRIMSSRSC